MYPPYWVSSKEGTFHFTTLIGNIYYCENGLAYLNGKKMPSPSFMRGFHIYAILIVFIGAIIPMTAAWSLADITMGGMTLINLPACVALSGVVIKAYKDYEKQKAQGLDPVFKAESIGMDPEELDFWK